MIFLKWFIFGYLVLSIIINISKAIGSEELKDRIVCAISLVIGLMIAFYVFMN